MKNKDKKMKSTNNNYNVVNDNVVPTPVVGQFQGIGRASWEWWQVVGELIDNTMTIDGDTKVLVTVDTKAKTFRIKDDSIGIPGKDLESVISLGKKVNQGKQLLSYSGVGMKSAIYWMGTDFELVTKPRSESGHVVYKLTPNFNTATDSSDMPATFTLEKMVDEMHPYGTILTIKGLKNFPKTIDSMDKANVWLGATYADYLDSGKLEAEIWFSQSKNITTFQLEPIRPLLTNKNNILDSRKNVGANEWEKEDTLKGNGWEVKIKAGRKLHPTNAMEYYESTNSKIFLDVYSTISSPYDWKAATSGINFKMKGKVILFNTERPSSRAESLVVEVDLIKGIEPSMQKVSMNTSTPEYKEMMEKVKIWLDENGFRSRTKVGTQALGENKDVRDKYKQVIKEDEVMRAEWGISLDKFDQQVSTETTLKGGRPDIYVIGDNKKVIIECKKEVIDANAIAQAAGYALETKADMIIMVAQKMVTGGTHYQQMYSKHLNIPILFVNILDSYKKPYSG
jgi:hypothetical protein